ncbi:hypothetical protein HanRHA438_Chr17g0798921 [Helianthus annuus]|nr:hypothetical protein HanRHA438_Chr17g0798921 [Helianthus annuus]
MIPESPLPRDAEAVIEHAVPTLSATETVLWKRMYESPTRAFTFSEGILAMGGLSPSYLVRPKAFFGKKRIDLVEVASRRFQGCQVVVGDEVDPGLNVEVRVTGGSAQVYVLS